MRTKYALAVTSGTAALQTAMAALEIGPGDEVILPAWTWHSCFNAVVLAGALPGVRRNRRVVQHRSRTISSATSRPQTKAHHGGAPAGQPGRPGPHPAPSRASTASGCWRTARRAWAAATRAGRWARIGDIAIYSLQLNKTITAGEGGAVATNDPLLFERAARFHDVGGSAPPARTAGRHGRGLGRLSARNFRMNEFTGGVLLAQLRKLDTIVSVLPRQRQARLRGHARSARHPASASCPTRRANSARASSSASRPKRSARHS